MEKKRGSLFTVRDAESAIITYTVLGLIYIIGICVYELVTGWKGVLQMLVRLDVPRCVQCELRLHWCAANVGQVRRNVSNV